MRSYRSVGLSRSGTSPLPSPAVVAQTPAAPPVGSGQAGFCGSFVPVKYAGRVGAAAGASAFAGSALAAGGCACWAKDTPRHTSIQSPTAKDVYVYRPPRFIIPPLLLDSLAGVVIHNPLIL